MKKPYEIEVGSSRGAPMGRQSDPASEFEGLIHLERVPFVDGDYDAGGAYWGGGSPLFCAWDDAGHECYVRAKDLSSAKRKLPASWTYESGSREAIVRGIAEVVWADAWSNHVEEHRCQSLIGVEITSAMPEIPTVALEEAEEIAKDIEKANNATLNRLLEEASEADKTEADPTEFGNGLAFMSVGSGASWFDNHERFPLKIPYGESSMDLRSYADDRCEKESDRIQCKECGVYGLPGERCSNCNKIVRKSRSRKK